MNEVQSKLFEKKNLVLTHQPNIDCENVLVYVFIVLFSIMDLFHVQHGRWCGHIIIQYGGEETQVDMAIVTFPARRGGGGGGKVWWRCNRYFFKFYSWDSAYMHDESKGIFMGWHETPI